MLQPNCSGRLPEIGIRGISAALPGTASADKCRGIRIFGYPIFKCIQFQRGCGINYGGRKGANQAHGFLVHLIPVQMRNADQRNANRCHEYQWMDSQANALPDEENLKSDIENSYCYITIPSLPADIRYKEIEEAYAKQRMYADFHTNEPRAYKRDQRKEYGRVIRWTDV